MTADSIYAITMPKWGMAMEEGAVVAWHVEEGAPIAVGEEIVDVESTKAASGIEAKQAGLLRRRIAEVGDVVPVGGLLAIVAGAEISDDAIQEFLASFETATAQSEAVDSQLPRRVAVGDRHLNYVEQGVGEVPIVLLHGFGGNLNSWLFNRPELAARHRVIALDLPGHGESDEKVGAGGAADLAAAVLGIMDALQIGRAHLVGHSMGGAVAIAIAADQPARVRSLTLVASAGLGPEIDGAYISGFLAAKRRKDMKAVIARLFAKEVMVSDRMLEDLIRMKRIDGAETALCRIAESFFPGGRQIDSGLRAALLGSPISYQVIWGREDGVIPWRHADGLANVATLDGAGHMVQMEKPSAVNRLILDFIEPLGGMVEPATPT